MESTPPNPQTPEELPIRRTGRLGLAIEVGLQLLVMAPLFYYGIYAILVRGFPLRETINFFLLLTFQGILHMASLFVHHTIFKHNNLHRTRYLRLVALILGTLLGGYLVYQITVPLAPEWLMSTLLLICISAVGLSLPLGLYYHIICWRELLAPTLRKDQAPR